MANKTQTKIDELSVTIFEPQPASAKATLQFCHGAWVGGWIWDTFAEWFADSGYRCVVPTWRGRYESRQVRDLGKVRMDEFVEDCLTVAAQSKPDVLIGESMGGLIALKAAERLSLKALVLMNPAPPFRPPVSLKLLINQIKYVGDLLGGKPNKPSEADYRALILNNMGEAEAAEFYKKICADSGTTLREMSMGSIKVDPNKIPAPKIVVIGHLDAILPLKAHRKTARLLGAEVIEYPTMSHHTFGEEGWEKVASELEGWIRSKLEAT